MNPKCVCVPGKNSNHKKNKIKWKEPRREIDKSNIMNDSFSTTLTVIYRIIEWRQSHKNHSIWLTFHLWCIPPNNNEIHVFLLISTTSLIIINGVEFS